MKTSTLVIIVLLLAIILQNYAQRLETARHHEQTREELLEVLAERNQLDSLYRDHLEQCSFISKKEVAVDSRGYFYSTYHNNQLLTQNN